MATLAKFRVESYTSFMVGGDEVRSYKLQAVSGDESFINQFYKYYPYGTMDIGNLTKDAWENLEVDKLYYIDFKPAE